MFKKPISLAVTIVGTSAFAWVAACSSSNSNNSSSSTSSGSSRASSGSSSTGASTNTGTSLSSSGTGSSSTGGGTASDGGGSCSGTASGTVIDDESAPVGTAISGVTPPTSCAANPGTWYDYLYGGSGGTLTPPQGMFAFSARPPGLPADAGASTTADGGALKAACISGVSSAVQYSGAGLGFNFATVATDGGLAAAVPYDTSSHAGGISFWAWGGGDAGSQTVSFGVFDKTTSPSGGVCDSSATPVASMACAPLSADQTFAPGWQFVKVNWTDLVQINGYGIPDTLDQTKIYTVQWQVQQGFAADAGGAPLPFNFCIANVSFY